MEDKSLAKQPKEVWNTGTSGKFKTQSMLLLLGSKPIDIEVDTR